MAPEIDKDETDCELLKRPTSSPPMCSKPPTPATHPAVCRPESPTTAAEACSMQAPVAKVEMKTARCVNRCTSCKKRVGLTGFRCRCGELFCGRHRYSDVHDCSFDYKAAGKAAIAKANPVVRAAKIIKI